MCCFVLWVLQNEKHSPEVHCSTEFQNEDQEGAPAWLQCPIDVGDYQDCLRRQEFYTEGICRVSSLFSWFFQQQRGDSLAQFNYKLLWLLAFLPMFAMAVRVIVAVLRSCLSTRKPKRERCRRSPWTQNHPSSWTLVSSSPISSSSTCSQSGTFM